jgi:hypothetical protein
MRIKASQNQPEVSWAFRLKRKINEHDLVARSLRRCLIFFAMKRAFSLVLKILAAVFAVVALFAPTTYALAQFELFNVSS